MPSMPTMPLPRPIPSPRRASRAALFALALIAPGLAAAQLFEDKDWKESEVPPPPSFVQSRAIPIDMPGFANLKYGIDPNTIVITKDGVVRYVLIASRQGGASNASYEGIRCATEEVKTYARFNDGKWDAVKDPDWRRFREAPGYVQRLSYQGMCRGHAPQVSVVETARILRNPVREVQ
jgi:hypothetical protein